MRAHSAAPVVAAALAGSTLIAPPVLAVNPQDMAIVGDMQYQSDLSNPGPTLDKLHLSEIELAYQGYLSPTARADVFLSIHPGETDPAGFEIEPEEAFVSLLDLPLGTALRLGKMKASFGKLNRFHPEQWYSVDQPLVLGAFLGGDGLQDLGAELSMRIPNPWDAFIQLNAAALNGGSSSATPAALSTGKAGSFRLSSSFDVTDDAYLETGLSGLAGAATASSGVGTNFLGGFDATYRWRPDNTTSFTTSGEFLALDRIRDDGSQVMPSGFYLQTDYQFLTNHDAGIRLDHTWTVDPGTTLLDAASAFYTFAPWEFNRYRIEVQHRWTYDGGYGATPVEDNRIMLQTLFTMGPHRHPVTF